MVINIRGFFLLTVGLLFCLFGCTRDRADVLIPDDISQPMEAKASFEQNVLPILTARCALSGCHVADGPHGLDFRTYQSFTAGGEHGSVFIPGNAQESEIIEEIVEGKMPPPPRDPLSDAEIQLFVDWINQQEPQDDIVPHDDDHKEDDEDIDDDHVDLDDAHDEGDDEHADDEDMDAHHDDDDEHANDDADDHDDDNND